MRIFKIIFCILSVYNCAAQKIPSNASGVTSDSICAGQTSKYLTNKLETCRYYYNRFFSEVVSHSLTNGFDVDDRFGPENTHSILRATHFLAINGDTIIQNELIAFFEKFGK